MSEPKTKVNDNSVSRFLCTVDDEVKRRECQEILEMMQDATGSPPKMWGTSLIGFGSYHYKYASGREGDWPLSGLSPRKANISIYIMPGFETFAGLMKKLGKHSTGKSCLYIKKLEDVDRQVLQELIRASVAEMRSRYPDSK